MPFHDTFKLNDGHLIPSLAIGCGTALYGKDASQAIAQAIETGVIHLDGAQAYGNEESLGAGIVASGVSRDKLYVTTKLNNVPEGKTVVDTLKESLKKLQLSYVDLFLIHSPFRHADLVNVWKGMEEAQRTGLAKTIGVSNHRIKDLESILGGATIVPAVNQIEYHPYVAKRADPLVEFCQKHGIIVTAYGGLTSVIRKKGGPVDSVVETVRSRLEKEAGSPVTEAQVILKWINQKNIVIITTTSKVERIKEYQEVANVPDLTENEVREISEAGYQLHYRHFAKQMDDL